MSSISRADLAASAVEATAEGAWLTVVFLVWAIPAGTALPVPFLWLVVAAFLGSLLGRRMGSSRTRTRWVAVLAVGVAVVAAIAAGALGEAASPGQAIARVFPVSLVAIAVLRGSRYDDADTEPGTAEGMLRWAPVGLLAAWLVGASFGGARRAAFEPAAFETTITFAWAGLLAVGIARLRAIRSAATLDTPRARAGAMLLLVVVSLLTLFAIPVAFAIGQPVDTVARGLVGPLVAAITFIPLMLGLLGSIILAPILEQLRGGGSASTPRAPLAPTQVPPGSEQVMTIGSLILIAIVLVVLAAVVVIVVRRVRRRLPPPIAVDALDERRSVAAGSLSRTLARVRPRLRALAAGSPRTASEAYRRVIDEWHDRPGLARLGAETPRSHARRIAAERPAAAVIGLLAADFELEEFRGRAVSDRESRRAVRRWRRLREVRPAADDAGTEGRRRGR